MPKNKGKGGKARRKGKGDKNDINKRELLLKEEGQEYAQIMKTLGGLRFDVFCFNDDGGINRLAKVRGKFKRRVFINRGDIVLVGLRDFQDSKCDIIHKYTAIEARRLKNEGRLPTNLRLDMDLMDDAEGDDLVDFDDGVTSKKKETEESDTDDDIDLDKL